MVLESLLRSRKFWLAAFAVVQAIVLHYLDIPQEIWQSISALIAVLITTIAVEDYALKSNENYPAEMHIE